MPKRNASLKTALLREKDMCFCRIGFVSFFVFCFLFFFTRVSRSWGSTVDMRAQRLRDLGFLVLKCDNRGSFRRYMERSFKAR